MFIYVRRELIVTRIHDLEGHQTESISLCVQTSRRAKKQPRSQGLLRFQDGRAEKTLAHKVIPPAKYSTNRGVFCHMTHNRISFSLHQPRSQGLLRFQDGGAEKTLAHTVMTTPLIGLKI